MGKEQPRLEGDALIRDLNRQRIYWIDIRADAMRQVNVAQRNIEALSDSIDAARLDMVRYTPLTEPKHPFTIRGIIADFRERLPK